MIISKEMKKIAEVGDLTEIFDNYNETIFIDEAHLSELGNKIIAEKIGVDTLNFLKMKKEY